jgi:hypothetical protein
MKRMPDVSESTKKLKHSGKVGQSSPSTSMNGRMRFCVSVDNQVFYAKACHLI